MFDHEKIDAFFTGEKIADSSARPQVTKHTRIVRWAKLLLPAAAALLLGLLLLFPSLNNIREFKIDITRPTKGELEKLHIQNTTFYVTDKSNRVNNFTADNLDETSPGSKLIKLINPKGIMPTSDSVWIEIQSPTGYFDQNANTLKLQDDVEMVYSDGMTVNVPDMIFSFTDSKGFSDKPVKARGHLGDLDSQGFEFYKDKNILIFTGKTHIVIDENTLKGK